MKSKVAVTVTILVLVLYSKIYSQIFFVINRDSINVYTIVNQDFISIIDSFIVHEKQYDYYNDSITFDFTILDQEGCVFQLSSGITQENEIAIFEGDDVSLCGVFYSKSHRFFINGRSLINEYILKKTNSKIQANIVRLNENEEVLIDDSVFPTIWIYIYSNHQFYLSYKSSYKINK